MDIFFNPGSVTVIGASKRNIGNFVVKNLLAGALDSWHRNKLDY